MIKFDIEIKEEDIFALRRAEMEVNAYKENIKAVLTTESNFNENTIRKYQDMQVQAQTEFDDLKMKVEKDYIPEYLYNQHHYNWFINYSNKKMTVEVNCDCGIYLVKNHDIDYKEYDENNED